MIRAEVSWWPGNVQPGGLHIHHVVFGLVFMLIGGVLAFAPIAWQSPWWEITGVLFGIGAALVLDEFALILHLDDVYWSEQGRKSIDVVFLCAALGGMRVLGASPLGGGDVSGAGEAVRYAWLSTVLINGLFVVISLLKGGSGSGCWVYWAAARVDRHLAARAARLSVGAAALQGGVA